MNKIKHQIYILLLLSFLSSNILGQMKTNVEVIQSLISKMADDAVKNIPNENEKKLELKFIAADNYDILKSKLIDDLQKNEIVLVRKNSTKLSVTLSEAKITYKDIFRDGILGEYLVERGANLNGSYFFENGNEIGKVNNFSLSSLDTVKYVDISKLENIAYTFTSAQVPNEPFFSSIVEPVIAIGTAAVAVYLFFNIRSK